MEGEVREQQILRMEGEFESRGDLMDIAAIEGIASIEAEMEREGSGQFLTMEERMVDLSDALMMIEEDIGDPATLPAIPYRTVPTAVQSYPSFITARQLREQEEARRQETSLSPEMWAQVGYHLLEGRAYGAFGTLSRVSTATSPPLPSYERLRRRLLQQQNRPLTSIDSIAWLKATVIQRRLPVLLSGLRFRGQIFSLYFRIVFFSGMSIATPTSKSITLTLSFDSSDIEGDLSVLVEGEMNLILSLSTTQISVSFERFVMDGDEDELSESQGSQELEELQRTRPLQIELSSQIRNKMRDYLYALFPETG